MIYTVSLLLFAVVVAIAFLLGKQREKSRQQERDKQILEHYEDINVNTPRAEHPFNELRD